MQRSRGSRWIADTALVLLTIAGMLVAGELGLRAYYHGSLSAPRYTQDFYEPHPKLGWVLKPGARTRQQELDFNVPIEINSKGLRDREHAYERTPGVHRVLIVSDSATFGSGVEASDTMLAVLGRRLGERVELINLAVPAYSTVQEHLLFLEEGRKYRPDVVILGFSPSNDVQTSYLPLQKRFQKKQRRPFASLDAQTGELVIDYTHAEGEVERVRKKEAKRSRVGAFFNDTVTARLGGAFVQRFRPGRRPDDPNIFLGWPVLAAFAPEHGPKGASAEEYETLWRDGWTLTLAVIDAMRAQAEADGARFAIFVTPWKLQVEARHRARVLEVYAGLRLDPEKPNREMRAHYEPRGVPVIDVLPELTAADEARGGGLFYDLEDEHLTALGSALVAEALAPKLRAAGLVPPARPAVEN